MYCLSISYKNTDVGIRKRFAFSADVRQKLTSELAGNGITQSVILCTCNRTELYFVADNDSYTERAASILADFGNIDKHSLSPYIRRYHDDGALFHLFRVACGIDSMIIGEDEILGQVKTAYQESCDEGKSGFELNTIFQSAIACSKKIKTETFLSKTSVSAATLAANEAAKLGENVCVLIIGATGKIGSSVLKNLLSHKNVSITQTIRRHNDNYSVITSPQVKTIDYSSRYDVIADSDCIISATTSPHYTLTYNKLKPILGDGKKRLFIDLAVPPDIESSVSEISGVEMIGIDHFNKLAEKNNALKLTSAKAAEDMIADDIDELKKRLAFHDFLPHMEKAKVKIDKMTPEEIIYLMRSELEYAEFSAILELLKKIGEEQ